MIPTRTLNGPAVPARSHFDAFVPGVASPFGRLRLPMVFHDKPHDVPPGGMPLEEFQTKALGMLEEVKSKRTEDLTAHAELKTLVENTFKGLETVPGNVAEIGKRLAALEAVGLMAQRTGLRGKSLLRTHEDGCKEFGEGMKKAAGPWVARAEGEDTTATGGNLVNPNLATDIYKLELEYGQSNLLDRRPMSTKTEKFIVETGEPDAVFVAENNEIPEQALSLSQNAITARKIAAIIGISTELLADSVVNLGAYVLDKFARANARRTDYVAFNGNGQSDVGGQNGGYIGLFNYGTAVVAGAGHTTVESMSFLDFLACLTGVNAAVLSNPDSCWMMHPTMIARALAVVDGNGRPIFLNALQAPANGGIGSILGYPVRLISVAPSDNSPSKPVAAFGDPMAYAVGARMEYEFDFSDHARFTSAQRVYRGMSRRAFQGKRSDALAILKTAQQ